MKKTLVALAFLTQMAQAVTYVLDIPKMSCDGCISTIKGTLKRQKGVETASIVVDLSKKQASFECKTVESCNMSEIQKALAAKKYPATLNATK